MIRLFIIFGLFVTSICHGQTPEDNPLFRIIENNKVGFIDAQGKIVINPIFLFAGEFSEGLAYARIGGTYGYIDHSGSFAIQPRFDYATPFNQGLAIVYIDGKPLIINKKGQIAFDCEFSKIVKLQNGMLGIKTANNKWGVLNLQGQLQIDTAFSRIDQFVDGMAVVEGLNHVAYDDEERGIKTYIEVGVIDSLGKFIIPYGKYEDISAFEDGYFKVQIAPEPWDTLEHDTRQTGFVDKYGKLVLARDHSKNISIDGDIHCGLVKMYLYRYWIPDNNILAYNGDLEYQGFMDLKGDFVISDSTFREVYDFSDNRAFVKIDEDHFSIINTKGELIAKNEFDDILEPGFKNGLAFVEVGSKWGLIDTNSNFVIKPKFDEINDIGIINDYFFFKKKVSASESEFERLYGICRIDGSIICNPILENFDYDGFENGLLDCIINDKSTFINMEGKIIWQETKANPGPLTDLNIDFMNRGYFYAYSKPNKLDNLGFAVSNNIPVKISDRDGFNLNCIEIVVRPEMKDTFFNYFNGICVFIANNTAKKINFNAQDSRLYMKVQALNKRNEWIDIEYLPSSWCGNSYHTLALEPKHFWRFVTPVYEGDFKTKLRIELKYIDPGDSSDMTKSKKEITLYSNEYDGNINPGQFWRKPEYYPNGFMDPYND